MRRGLIPALSLFLLVAGGLAFHFSPAQRETRALKELAAHCDIPAVLTQPEKEISGRGNYTELPGFGGFRLENDDISLTFSGYPDVQDLPYCLTGFTIRSPRYSLFGLHTGCTLDEAEKALENWGYRPVQEPSLTDWTRPLCYVKDSISIVLGLAEDLKHTASFSVSVAVTNREGVVF